MYREKEEIMTKGRNEQGREITAKGTDILNKNKRFCDNIFFQNKKPKFFSFLRTLKFNFRKIKSKDHRKHVSYCI